MACSSRVPGEPIDTTGDAATTDPDAAAVATDGSDTTGPIDTTDTSASQTDTADETDSSNTDTTNDSSDSSGTDTDDTASATDDTDTTEPDNTDTDTSSTDSTSSETTDAVTTDETSGTTDAPDSGPGNGSVAPPDDMVVVSSFDATDPVGFRDGSSTFASLMITRADSVGELVLPFSAGAQEGAWSFNFGGDYCGYELVARVKLTSGFNETAAAAGGVQLRAWSDGWNNFAGNWTTLSGVGASSKLGQWVEYRFDLDTANELNSAFANFDPSELHAVGISFISGVTAGAPFSEATFELDWIGVVPKAGGCPDVSPEAGTTDDLTDDASSDTTSVDTTSVDTTDDTTAEPMPDVIVVSEFDELGGFAGYDNLPGDFAQTLSVADSIGTVEVPFTEGNYQQSSWNFGFTAPEGGLCGYDLVARVRLDAGFNEDSAAAGGIQLRAWSDNAWSGNIQGWGTLDATAHTGEWREYRLSLDTVQDGATFNPATLHAVGIAFISGGAVEAVYSAATFSVDWIRFEAQEAGMGGCAEEPETDAGVDSGTDDGGVPGDLDGGAGDADSGVDEDAGMIDEDAGVIDEDAGADSAVDSNEDAGAPDAAVEDNGAIDPPANALLVLTDMATSGSKTEGTPLAPGYYAEEGSMSATTDYVIADSVATFTVPFTASGQNYQIALGAGGLDGTGHELIVRLRVLSEPLTSGTAVQLVTWSSDGAGSDYNYNDNYISVPTIGYSDWTEYKLDIDIDGTYPDSITLVGFAVNSGYANAPVYSEIVFEVDWVAVVPKP